MSHIVARRTLARRGWPGYPLPLTLFPPERGNQSPPDRMWRWSRTLAPLPASGRGQRPPPIYAATLPLAVGYTGAGRLCLPSKGVDHYGHIAGAKLVGGRAARPGGADLRHPDAGCPQHYADRADRLLRRLR